MTYVLYTSMFSLLEFGHQLVMDTLSTKLMAGNRIIVSTNTVEESLGGWYTEIRKSKDFARQASIHVALARSMSLIGQFPIEPMTENALNRSDQLVKSKINIGRSDCKIASLALEIGAIVVTRNLRDFRRVPDLICEDWSTPLQKLEPT